VVPKGDVYIYISYISPSSFFKETDVLPKKSSGVFCSRPWMRDPEFEKPLPLTIVKICERWGREKTREIPATPPKKRWENI